MILFRADGNSKIGSGHIMRCLSLADVFRELGHTPFFISASEHLQSLIQGRGYQCHVLRTEYSQLEHELSVLLPLLIKMQPELLVLDSYFVTPNYMNTLKLVAPLAYIDDRNDFDYPADIVVNYNNYAQDMHYPLNKKYLLGPQYAPLRKEFRNISAKNIKKNVDNILFLTGGTDLEHVILKILRYMQKRSLPDGIKMHIVLGAMNRDVEEIEKLSHQFSNVQLHKNVTNMQELMELCDVAVSAAGTTLYELCACGVPTVTYVLADNQILPARAFEEKGLMPCAGDVRADDGFLENIFFHLNQMIREVDIRKHMSEMLQGTVDGNGARRLAEELWYALKGGN